ncbi:MAG: zinc-ribbon domain-containing protein [Blastocatellia bacterium]|nr:zinc-ribbon domain-containing protein [Blastocatellia bacterium]
MFCPKCGTQALSDEQRFCKSCGTNLSVVAQALSAPQLPPTIPAGVSPTPIPLAEIPQLPYLQEELNRQMLHKVGWAMTVTGAMCLLGITIFMAVLSGRSAMSGLGVPIFLIGFFVFLIGFFLLMFTRVGSKQSNLPQVIFAQPPNQQPLGNLQMAAPGMQAQLPPPAVNSYTQEGYLAGTLTERTTDRLEIPVSPAPRDTR